MLSTHVPEQRNKPAIRCDAHLLQEIYAACQKIQERESLSWLTCVDYLLAVTEYEAFMELACDHAGMQAMGEGGPEEEWLPADTEVM